VLFQGESVQITCETAGAKILYSIDESEPSIEYTAPIVITKQPYLKLRQLKRIRITDSD